MPYYLQLAHAYRSSLVADSSGHSDAISANASRARRQIRNCRAAGLENVERRWVRSAGAFLRGLAPHSKNQQAIQSSRIRATSGGAGNAAAWLRNAG